MPHFKNVAVYNPIILQSASSLTRVSEINPVLSTTFSHYALQGDASRRGAAHFVSNNLRTVLLRGGYLGLCPNISQSEAFTEFADDFNPGPAPAFSRITSLRSFNEYLWMLGSDTANEGRVLAVPQGSDLTAPGSYVNRSADIPANSVPYLLTRARDIRAIYYTAIDAGGALWVLRGTEPSTPFVNICVTAFTPGTPSAYGVNDSGTVHMLFTDSGAYRSLDGGANWAAMVVPLAAPILEVTYSKFYNRWCISNAALNILYTSKDNGSTWTQSQWASTGTNFTARTRITHLERLDSEGRYILAVSGFRTIYPAIYTYLSEDGGASWVLSQVLKVPNYNPTDLPSGSTIALINAGSRVFLYHGNTETLWNFDNSAFISPLLSFSTP